MSGVYCYLLGGGFRMTAYKPLALDIDTV